MVFFEMCAAHGDISLYKMYVQNWIFLHRYVVIHEHEHLHTDDCTSQMSQFTVELGMWIVWSKRCDHPGGASTYLILKCVLCEDKFRFNICFNRFHGEDHDMKTSATRL